MLALVTCAQPAAAETLFGEAQVIDGDTIEVQNRRIRLFGIDAPELQQTCNRDGEVWACGEASREQLAELVGNQQVSCEGEEIDQYGRLMAVCSAGRWELNRTMVEQGWATAFRQYSQVYVAYEIRARGERRGLWRSTFALPEEFRQATAAPETNPEHERRMVSRVPVPSGQSGACVIKGNRSSRGEWIYHMPGRPFYDQTRAEELFCSEAEAIAAGYRRSKA